LLQCGQNKVKLTWPTKQDQQAMGTAESTVLRVLIIIVLIPLARNSQAMKDAERLNLCSTPYSFTAKNSVIGHARTSRNFVPHPFRIICAKDGKAQPVPVKVSCYATNDVPQPQELLEFGLINLNPCRMIVSS